MLDESRVVGGIMCDPKSHATLASSTLSSEILHTSTSSIRLGLDDMVMTQLVPMNLVPALQLSNLATSSGAA